MIDPDEIRPVGRRRFLQGIAAIGGLALVGAACSSDSKTGSTTGSSPTTAGPTSSNGSATTTAGANRSAATTAPSTAPEDAAKPGGDLSWIWLGQAISLHPKHVDVTYWAQHVAVYDTLMYTDPATQAVEPRIAESVEPNADFTEWTIKLRPGVTFTDGTPLNAAAVVYNYDLLANPDTAASIASTLKLFSSWTAVDDLTVKMTSDGPMTSFLQQVSSTSLATIASPAALEKYGQDYGTAADKVVGAGPFTVDQWVPSESIKLVRNPQFWDQPRPYLDSLTLLFSSDTTVRADGIISGDVDLAFFTRPPGAVMERLKATDLVQYSAPPFENFSLHFNQAHKPLDDPRIRKALLLATDIPAYLDFQYGGFGKDAMHWFQPESPFYDAANVQADSSLEEAQKLVDAWKADNGGQDANVKLLVFGGSVNTATFLMQQWNRLKGLVVTPDQPEQISFNTRTVSGDFDFVLRTSPRPGSWVQEFYDSLHSKSTGNFIGVNYPELDQLLEDGLKAYTVEDRKTAFSKIIKFIFDNTIYAALEAYTGFTAAKPEVKGARMLSSVAVSPTFLWVDR